MTIVRRLIFNLFGFSVYVNCIKVTCCCKLSYHERMTKLSTLLSPVNIIEEIQSECKEGQDEEEDEHQPQPELY